MHSSTADGEDCDVLVSPFDYSTENHFRAMDKISELCGEDALCVNGLEESSVTFVRQWKDFRYVPRTVKFVHEIESRQGKDVSNGVNLPQFSAASVPKMEQVSTDANSSKLRKDFVLYVGGHVWALDWCPRVDQKSDCDIKCEYLAVSAHPPESSYHKIGAALTGRGVIQIWCVLNVSGKEEDLPPLTKKKGKQGRPRKNPEESSSMVKKPRGRPRKIAITEESSGESDSNSQLVVKDSKPLKKAKGRPRKAKITEELIVSDGSDEEFLEDVLLPRLVLCLAHNGKVAWDVKWRPLIVDCESSEDMHRMGYLAVLLGNGSLEVWEVPSPKKIKVLYASHHKDSTDPRFMKLAPVFKCSELKTGDRQSIPLTLEWSRASPHDLIIAGCHDGTVALWKFFPTGSPQDTRPLLRFSADSAPIRSLAWAPCGSDVESANVIATAGHGGLRFWDLRDPYRPLWDLNPMRRTI